MRREARLMLGACSVGALMVPMSALAQGAGETPVPEANSAMGIGDIVVTAQRRAESVQKSSLAIDVVSGEDLMRAGVSRTEDLTRLVPGLQLAQLGPTAQPFIRGVGNANNTGLADSGVAFNVDGVYIGQSVAYGLSFYDLARIEVLKGPQGTLYGRNATGGAINLITNEPGNDAGGYATFEFGNYNHLRATGGANVPLGPDLSARIAYNFVNRDGFFRDGTGDDVQQAGRLRLKYAPEGFTLHLNAEYGHVGGIGGGGAVLDGNLDGNPANGLEYNLVNPWDGMGSPYNLANYNVARDKSKRQFNDITAFAISAQLDVDLAEDLTLTVLPAYRKVDQQSSQYLAGFLFEPIDYAFKQFSGEMRLGYNADRWKWVLGAYYFRQTIDSLFHVDQQVIPTGAVPPSVGTSILLLVDGYQKTRSYSFFGETTYSVTDALRVIGGIRYTKDKTDGDGTQTFSELPGSPVCTAATPCVRPYDSQARADDVSWKGGFEYDLGAQSMLFATASRGFKAGGILTAQAPRNTFKPEILLAYTLGLRNRFLDNRLQVNLEAFYWDYKDKQETIAGFDSCGGPVCPAPLPPGNLTNLTINIDKARIYGGSADILFRVSPVDTLHTAVEYAKGEYVDFTFPTPSPPNTGCQQTPPSGSNPFYTADCSGFPLTRAPKWTVVADYQHVFELGDGGDITANGSFNYTSSRYLESHLLTKDLAPGYTLFNADVTYNSPGKNWSLTAYIRNITDEAAPITASGALAETGTLPFVSTAVLQPPRTYGLRFTANF